MRMPDGAKFWLFKTAALHYWRVEGFYEMDDLLQEGYMCWWRVNRNYPLDRPPQIMAKFMIAFHHELHTMSKKRTSRDWLLYMEEPPDVTYTGLFDEGMAETFAGLPRKLSEALESLQLALADYLRSAPYPVRADGTRERTDERAGRVSGLADLTAEILASLAR